MADPKGAFDFTGSRSLTKPLSKLARVSSTSTFPLVSTIVMTDP
jgi:hypothetical protein